MKRLALLAVCLAALCALMPAPCPAGRHVQTVTVVGNNAPPFRIIEGQDFFGIYFDAFKEIAKRAGFKVRFVEAPFKRALAMMKQGAADVMLGPNRSPEREAYMAYTAATFPPADKAFYVYPKTARVTAYEDLAHMTLAVQQGKKYFPRLDADRGLRKVKCFDQFQAIEKVLTGECDVVVMPEQEGDYLLLQLGISLDKSPFVVPGETSFITISRTGPAIALRRAIEQAMAQMNADGTMQAILERYR